MEMAKSVRKKDSGINIIFTTGITGYMEEGYEVEALHYLVKPVDKNKLHICMDKVLKKKKDTNYIIVHSRDEVHKITTSQINYIEQEDTSVWLKFLQKKMAGKPYTCKQKAL